MDKSKVVRKISKMVRYLVEYHFYSHLSFNLQNYWNKFHHNNYRNHKITCRSMGSKFIVLEMNAPEK